jgi:hypothetical protein
MAVSHRLAFSLISPSDWSSRLQKCGQEIAELTTTSIGRFVTKRSSNLVSMIAWVFDRHPYGANECEPFMMPLLTSDERAMLCLISSHYVVPIPLFKPITDGLEAKRLVTLDRQGVWRMTELGEAVISRTGGRPH